jgi:hypothetical protein
MVGMETRQVTYWMEQKRWRKMTRHDHVNCLLKANVLPLAILCNRNQWSI